MHFSGPDLGFRNQGARVDERALGSDILVGVSWASILLPNVRKEGGRIQRQSLWLEEHGRQPAGKYHNF